MEVAGGGSVLSYDRYWLIVLLLSHPCIPPKYENQEIIFTDNRTADGRYLSTHRCLLVRSPYQES